ncbi:MAG: hypothetical protein B9J98_02165 [Candidatus Terraquivivens tikiterensis]|uniref:DNA double-strand break repair Rad50 ATPase n=1 Tax=Candidatus Terraquivivens tikiterensis TaxID=1980982 RepID=A0A2R7Y8X3_9ARCH|nr:MAG: hypothetical protein B9J98_02165 [Candidatus Terraquivivens tikiterensis]
MIARVLLKNFISHSHTELSLGPGLHVFVGRNGSGKTSVIDGITYALFGKHGRGENVNIARDGAHKGGVVEVEFMLGGKRYLVSRSFDSQGRLEDAYVRVDGKPLVKGEKKREDTVTKKVEEVLGMGYERMRASVVIQQGEIDRILSWQPREIKALFDDLLGLGMMESAYARMGNVIKDFEERVREETKYSVDDVERISKEISESESALTRLEVELREKEERFAELKERRDAIKSALETMERYKDAYYDALSKVNSVKLIAKDWIRRKEEEIERCASALRAMGMMDEVSKRMKRRDELKDGMTKLEAEIGQLEREINKIKAERAEVEKRLEALGRREVKGRAFSELIREVENKTAELVELAVELGRALSAEDGREIALKESVEKKREEIIQLFMESYTSGLQTYFEDLRARARRLYGEEEELSSRLESLRLRLRAMREELEKASRLDGKDVERLNEEVRRSKAVLEAAGINSNEELELERKALEGVKRTLAVIQEDALPDVESLRALAVTDEAARMVKEAEAAVSDAKAFDKERYEELRKSYEELQRSIGVLQGELERIRKEIQERDEKIRKLREVLSVLRDAKRFRDFLMEIRDKVYHRDGPVLKSLRSWAIKETSRIATGHLEMFNASVDGVKLEEVKNELVIKCYQRGLEVDAKRLSGGEKVAVALALRLAIGDVLGARRLGFFVLDEPTVHLDSENKKRLAEVFSALSRDVRQVIVITHDEEVFEESEAILHRFERGPGREEYTRVEPFGKLTHG